MDEDKKDPKDPLKEKAFLAEVDAINEAMDLGAKTSAFNWALTEAWMEKRKLAPLEFNQDAEGKLILGRFKESINHLSKLNDRYNKLCKDVNTYYGKEMLKSHPPMMTFIEIMKRLNRDRGMEDEGGEDWKV